MTRWPVDGTPVIASGYLDPRRNPPHYGTDLAGKDGDPVSAPERMSIVAISVAPDPSIADNTNFESCLGLPGGLVCLARDRKWAPWTGYGPGIVVGQGASGKFHLLAHLAIVSVDVGQLVEEGGLLGEMAAHVGASGTHTHWEVRDVAVDDGPKTRAQHTVDPAAWLVSTGGGGPVAAAVARKPASASTLIAIGFLLWLVSRR